jgi:hypothetical protein
VYQLLLKKHVVPFAVILGVFSFSGCEKKFDSFIDPVQSAPVIMDASSSIALINTDTINIGTERKPDDLLTIRGVASMRVIHPEGKKEISAVKYSIFTDQSSSSLGEGDLNDNGNPPDRTANDSIYSGYIEFQINRVLVGKLVLSLWSENSTGRISNTVFLPLTIVRLNRAPVISDLVAPDTINLAETTSFHISIKVVDSDGQQDIKSMIRFTPSGKMLPLAPYNDSIYVETVSLVPPPALGSYNFRFRAADRSNDSSNVVTQPIIITKQAIGN